MSDRLPLPEPLPRPVTDAHTHLAVTTERSGLGVDEAVRLARLVGVTRLVDIGSGADDSAAVIANAEAHDAVIAAVAVHPNDAARLGDRLDGELARLEALLGTSPRVRAVGETGLDYFRTSEASGRALQRWRPGGTWWRRAGRWGPERRCAPG